MYELRCSWCLYSLSDTAPPLPFLPHTEVCEVLIHACCWRCGARFNVVGNTLRERQIDALFYSTPPVRVYTDERARALYTYVIQRYYLHQKLAAREDEKESTNYHKSYQKEEEARKQKEMLRSVMRPQAKQRIALYQRVEAEFDVGNKKLRKRFGEMPRDMESKTFAELEIIIFGDASDEARALDEKI